MIDARQAFVETLNSVANDNGYKEALKVVEDRILEEARKGMCEFQINVNPRYCANLEYELGKAGFKTCNVASNRLIIQWWK